MEMSIDIEFSTLEPNGLLIWQGDDTNFFAVVGRSKLISYTLCTLTNPSNLVKPLDLPIFSDTWDGEWSYF